METQETPHHPDISVIASKPRKRKLLQFGYQVLPIVFRRAANELSLIKGNADVKLVPASLDVHLVKKVELPKPKLSGYQKFCQENFEIVRKQNPGISGGELFKLVANKWNTHKGESKMDEGTSDAIAGLQKLNDDGGVIIQTKEAEDLPAIVVSSIPESPKYDLISPIKPDSPVAISSLDGSNKKKKKKKASIEKKVDSIEKKHGKQSIGASTIAEKDLFTQLETPISEKNSSVKKIEASDVESPTPKNEDEKKGAKKKVKKAKK